MNDSTHNSAVEVLRSRKDSWNEWRRVENGSDQITLAGEDLSEMDIEGVDLSGLDARDVDLYGSNLMSSNLKMTNLAKADLSYANLGNIGGYKLCLEGAHLMEANLDGADLTDADLQGADLRGASLRGTNLQGAMLDRAKLNNADMEGASLVDSSVVDADFSFANFGNANLTSMRYGGHKTMRGLYYGVRGLESAYGNAMFVRDARDQDYLDTLEVMIDRLPEGKVKKLERVMFRAWSLIDYGRSLAKVSWYAFIIATIYAFFYSLDMYLGWGLMDYSSSAKSWFTPFYYSIVTYTTLGFGDVTANNWLGEVIVISEVIVGYFTLGLLLSILANTIARRS